MVAQFQKEWPVVARVRQYIGDPSGGAVRQGPLALSGTNTSATLHSVTQAVTNSVEVSDDDDAVAQGFALFGDAFWILSSIAGGASGWELEAFVTGWIAGLADVSSDSITAPTARTHWSGSSRPRRRS